MKGIIIVNEVPRNCRFCQFRSEYGRDDSKHGFCIINGDADCDRDAAYRPKNCPINTYEDEIAQLAEQISREHLMTIQELEQKGLIKDDVISRPYIVTKEMYERLLKKDGKIKGE